MKMLRIIYTAYAVLMFVILMFIFSLFIAVPLIISHQGGKTAFVFIRLWAKSWSFLVGIGFLVHGREHIDPGKPYIYIFNHRSFLDAPVIPMAIQQEIRAIGKKELSKIPVFGFITSRVAVWVDRRDVTYRKASVERLVEILERGISIVVAPEGTRNDTVKALLPFRRGAFRLSLETQTTIMPMSIIGADRLLPKGSLVLKPGKIHIYFSPAIRPGKPTGRKCRGAIDRKMLFQIGGHDINPRIRRLINI